ncbi:MAG: 50S ribosomal protein L6 [Gammaproteobacteria bacterium]|nr:50S ribosomal protein L6 [Gammaproteobacteria bacterium]
MSRVANQPIEIPKGVDVTISGRSVTVKGSMGTMRHEVHQAVDIAREENLLKFAPRAGQFRASAFAGTTRAVINNMVQGVGKGFEKRLALIGIGYRAQAKGKKLNLTLGFSHPVAYPVPEGIQIETPSNTEIVVKGFSKQQVGQVAAEIRSFRSPEPYKGKGIRYVDEMVVRKEAKKT